MQAAAANEGLDKANEALDKALRDADARAAADADTVASLRQKLAAEEAARAAAEVRAAEAEAAARGGSADLARWQARAKDLEQRVAAAAAEHVALSEELLLLKERYAGLTEALEKVRCRAYLPAAASSPPQHL